MHQLSACSYPVFVIRYVAEHVIQVQNAAIAMFETVHLKPVAGILGRKHSVLTLKYEQTSYA